jgi:hypothetical protein
MDLEKWLQRKTGILSVDVDFFTREEERPLAPRVESWVARKVAAGARVAFRDEHVDLIELISRPVDFVLNFDFHMDCRIEFLHGDEPKSPPCSASVFEGLLSQRLVERYIWAFPISKRRRAASVYSSAFSTTGRQLLTRIHCVSGRDALDELLPHAAITAVFVCRSPDYATADTDAIFADLRSAVAAPSR